MKRVLSVMLVLALVFSVVPTVSAADSADDFYVDLRSDNNIGSGTQFSGNDSSVDSIAFGVCGDNLTWSINSSGNLSIIGFGPMTNYSHDGAVPWKNYRNDIKTVSITYGVTSIGSWAFSYCENLVNIDIPSSVTSIGYGEGKSAYSYTFHGCEKLTNVLLPDGLIAIGNGAFQGCRNLINISIPDSVTCIAAGAFNECNNLQSIVLSKNLNIIGFTAFGGCSSLKSMEIPSCVKAIDEQAFFGCKSLTEVIIPNGITTLGSRTFSWCSGLKKIFIPNSVVTMGDYIFPQCMNLTDIYYSGSEREWNRISIGDNAELVSITIHYNCNGFPDNTGGGGGGFDSGESKPAQTFIYQEEFDGTEYKTEITFDWDLRYLTNIGTPNQSLALAGLFLSHDAYAGKTDVSKRMISLGLLDDESNLQCYEDSGMETGNCIFVGTRTIIVDGEECNIISAVARGTTGGFTEPEWIGNLLWSLGFFERRGDMLYNAIVDALAQKGLTINNPHNRFFITGHSLGAAVGGYAGNKLLSNGVANEQLACYTFASPFNCTAPKDLRRDSHIYNYIGKKDFVPTVGQATNATGSLIWGMQRYGNDIVKNYDSDFTTAYKNLYGLDYAYPLDDGWRDGSTAGNLNTFLQLGFEHGGIYHTLAVYLAQIIASGEYSGTGCDTGIRNITVLCPVDVYVYDKDGNVIASVVNNEVVLSGNEDVIVAVYGDKKFIAIRNGEDYTVRLNGNEVGDMTYIVQETVEDASSGQVEVEAQVYAGVQLYPGKEMVSDVGAATPVEEVTLNTVDAAGDILNTIATDGIETPKSDTIHSHYGEWTEANPDEELLLCVFCGEQMAKRTTDRIISNVTITGVTVATNLSYTGNPQPGYTGTPTSAYTGEYDINYSGRNTTSYSSADAPTNAGDYTVTIRIPESDETYTGSISLDFTIAKATPDYTAPTNLTATESDTLADVPLPDGWTWDAPDTDVGTAGQNQFPATFTPEDEANYNTVAENVTIAVSEAHVHSFSPDWTSDANYHWHAAICGHTGEVSDRAAHVPGAAATCTTAQTCTICGYELAVALDHDWGGDWAITAQPTETVPGTAERTCSRDTSHKDTVTLPVLTDTAVWTAGTRVEPTEDENGSQVYTSEYGDVTVTIPALSHTHSYGDQWQHDTVGHWHECACGDKASYATHTWNDGEITTPATCTADGVKTFTCTVCDATKIQPITATGHTPVTNPAVAATCTQPGKTAGSHCSVCNTVLTAQEEVEALGHTWVDATAEAPKTCSVCGKTEGEPLPPSGGDKSPAVVTATPTAVETLTYTGEAQALVTAGDATGGTMEYSLDGTAYSTEIPTTTNAGEYTVYYRIAADAKHTDIAAQTITVTIAKAVPNYGEAPSGLTAKVGQTLANVKLPEGWAWDDALTTSVGVVGSNTFSATYTPNDTNNYNPVTVELTVVVSKASGNVTTQPSVSHRPASQPAKPEDSSPDIPSSPDTPSAPDSPAVTVTQFTDIAPGAWYYDAVKYVVEKGLFNGTSDTTFSPNVTTTRGMLATVLYRIEEEPAAPASSFFDVPNDMYYTQAIAWAADKGIVNGYDNGGFGPEDTITREQLAVMLWRYTGSPTPTATLDGFMDSAKVSNWATNALRWAVEKGILQGKDNKTLDPQGQATRAEVATMMYRYLIQE